MRWGKKTPQGKRFFSYKMFKMKVSRFWKINNIKLTKEVFWINSKIWNRGKITTLKVFLFCHYCWSLLWWTHWRSLMLWKSTSWSSLSLLFKCSLSMRLILINNRKKAGNSVEKYCFLVLNVKLQVKRRFKTFYQL